MSLLISAPPCCVLGLECSPNQYSSLLWPHLPGGHTLISGVVTYSLGILTSHPKCIELLLFLCLHVYSLSIAHVKLEKEMATHSSIHAWKIPWAEEPGGLQSIGLQESDAAEHMKLHCTCFDEWYGRNRNWGFMLEFLIFLTSHMQSNSRIYQFLFHALLNKTLCDPVLGHFSCCSSNLPRPHL